MQDNRKILANQIKADLQKDLEKVKKGDEDFRSSWGKTLGEGCGDYRGNEWRFTYYGETKTAAGREKAKKEYVFVEELESNDWKEIEGLIQQIDKPKKEKREREKQKKREEEAKRKQKLSSNQKLFFYDGLWEWSSSKLYHSFRGIKNGQEFYVVFPENYPAIANLPNGKINNREKEKLFYLIEGVENIPLQSKSPRGWPWKPVNLTSEVTITVAENQDLPEKEWLVKDILQYFQKNDIKSIKLDGNKLLIKYNHKEEEEPNSSELQQIQQYIQNHSSNNQLTLEELQQTNIEKPTNYLPYILGGIGIILVIGVIAYLLMRNKNKEN